jgi:aspartate/methionine/tyrosine aminotransferase
MSKIAEGMKKEGKKTLIMYEGDPVIFGHINQPLSDYLIEAAKKGLHMYGGMAGVKGPLTKSISNWEKRYRGNEYLPEDIVIGAGVSGCLAIIHDTLLDAGDEIVALAPAHYLGGPTGYFYKYGAKAVASPCVEEDGWQPDLDELRKKITANTKAITVVSPNNPTGAIYKDKALKEIANIAGEHDIPIISDEIYGVLTFDGKEAKSMASLAGDVPVIVTAGLAKVYQRTGWGVGYICFHDPQNKISELKNAVKRVASLYGFFGTRHPTEILYASAKAFESSLDAAHEMMRKLQERRDYTIKRFKEINGLSCFVPEAALYAFPRVEGIGSTWKTDNDFILDVYRETGARYTAGSSMAGPGHFRTLLLPEMEMLEEAYDKLEQFMKSRTR